MYGNATDTTTGPWGWGVFGVKNAQSVDTGASVPTTGCRLADIVDGTSNTLMISEGVVPTVTWWGGAMGEIIYGNMGGALFSASLTPNSSSPDRPVGPCPADNGDTTYKPPCVSLGGNAWWTPSGAGGHAAARSRHFTGVNAALGDCSVRFVSDSVDLAVWRALGTRQGREATFTP